MDPEARVAKERPEARDRDQRDPQHEEPVVGVGELGEREAAEGRRHALDLRAEDEQRALAQQQAEPPCCDKGRQELAVEAADDDALQHDPCEPGPHSAEDHGDAAGHAREIGEGGDVGADHHHLAVRHVDDAHHAEDDDQPDRGEREDPDRVGVLVEQADDERDGFHRADRQRLEKTCRAGASTPARSRVNERLFLLVLLVARIVPREVLPPVVLAHQVDAERPEPPRLDRPEVMDP